MFKAFLSFLVALPEIIKFIHRIMDSLEAAEKRTQLKKDLGGINAAIDNNDLESAIKLFNERFSKSSPSVSPTVQPHKD